MYVRTVWNKLLRVLLVSWEWNVDRVPYQRVYRCYRCYENQVPNVCILRLWQLIER